MDLVHLNQLSDSKLSAIIEAVEGICISLILPIQQETDKRAENRIRLKNLIQEAQEKLAALDHGQSDIEQLLAPAEDLVKGGRFFATESPGLAIYLARDFSRAYQLPFAPNEMVSVSRHFLFKPLMPLHLNEYFYILALSQQEVRLLRATQYRVKRMELGDMPENLADALRWDDPEKQLQWHSQTSMQVDGRAAMFHGHGVGTKETHKKNLLRYFQMLDKGLRKLLVNEKAPLVLAGVDYLLPIFREASTYGHLFDEEITGNHQAQSDRELQRQAWLLVRPYYQQKREAAAFFYHQRASKALASAELATVVRAAYQGRVDTLFVAMDEQKWGKYDPGTDQITLHSQAQPGDEDLLNFAVVHTVLNSGDVFTNLGEEFPETEPLAAILRY